MQSKTLSAVGFAHAKPERAAELGRILLDLAERSATEQGYLRCFIHRDLADPNRFVFYESWQSAEDVARHLEQPYMKDFLAARMDYLAEDLTVHQLSAVESGPAAMNDEYVRAYNARDVDAVMAVYAEGALAVWEPGRAVTGDEHRRAVVEFMKKEPKLSAEVRECHIADDMASLIVDWSIEVPGAPEMTGSGRGFDVLKRNADGQWRYVITNPFGRL